MKLLRPKPHKSLDRCALCDDLYFADQDGHAFHMLYECTGAIPDPFDHDQNPNIAEDMFG